MEIKECECLEDVILVLQEKGCSPSIYKRGDQWRAHVNRFGNYWSDCVCPFNAMMTAATTWEKAGCPEDGGTG